MKVLSIFVFLAALGTVFLLAWDPLPVADDPLVRMPGTQPSQGVSLEAPNRCLNCHGGYNPSVEPGFNWQGSMMAQSARDFLFWACLTVAAQDSIWAVGTPNAVDLCERCHFPKGWLEGRSDPPNVSAMTGADYDGVQCDFCHRMWDPFFETTYDGSREGSDWVGYWDESNVSSTPSQLAADESYAEDSALATGILQFNGSAFFETTGPAVPVHSSYAENTSGQYFVSLDSAKRASFADAAARHQMLYSRYHKSKYFCGTCHDVSNPVLANLGADPTQPLPTETSSPSSYYHVERTFSEFMLSDYGLQGGAPGKGPFSPDQFETSLANNYISKCQDCHMRDVTGAACNKNGVPIRPNDSVEHPESGQPLHDLTGGNAWVTAILASSVPGSPNYDAVNDQLLNQGPGVLTLDLTQGLGLNPDALLAGSQRALQQLQLAASIENLSYSPASGALSFRIQNQSGHRLISGFPEGRRMFVNVKAYQGNSLIYEVNPYDGTVGTIRGLPNSPNSPLLGANQAYVDELVYEMHPSSALTGEQETFHFVLADGRYKDNRIPPKGFRIAEAAARHAQPVWHGVADENYFTAAEYAGGYDEVSLTIPAGADSMEVHLYYQTTSREYVEFLRDEIKGTASTLNGTGAGGDPPYIIQTDPFFSQLKAWGDTIWQLWTHNKDLPGAAPIEMAEASWGDSVDPCTAPVPTLISATPGQQQVTLTWTDEHSADPDVVGYSVYYDQSDKAQLITSLEVVTTYLDSGLTNGQEYCYKITANYTSCESDYSNVVCAVPNSQGQLDTGVDHLQTGHWETTGKGKNKTTTFVVTADFARGEQIVIQAEVLDRATGLPLSNATVDLAITGPETLNLTSGPSGGDGIAEASWQTEAPNKRGQGGTALGQYTVTVTQVNATGYTWDGVGIATSFTIQ